MTVNTQYAELHCISNFTFLRGASKPEELVKRAVELNYTALAITDECSVAGVVRAYRACKDTGLKLIIGSEFVLSDGFKLVLLASSRVGYARLSRFITLGRKVAEKGSYLLTRGDIEANDLSGCLAIWLPSGKSSIEDGKWLKGIFGDNTWLGVELHCNGRDKEWLEKTKTLGDAANIRLVACGDVHMHVRNRRMLQDALTAIRLNKPVSELGYALYPNGERHLRPKTILTKLYPQALLRETVSLAERINFSLDELRYEYPREIVPAGHTPASWLRELTYKGAHKRYPDGLGEKLVQQLEHELKLIGELKYEPYFLTVHDVVNYARTQNILCQGRGSAANSAVCYCLEITSVNPEQMSLLFERFISRERHEPPDIDVDFEHERREEVIQYIYDRYTRDRTAIAATVITYGIRSAIRDIGKALGFSLDQIERISDQIRFWDNDVTERLLIAGFDPKQTKIQQLIYLVCQIYGFPRHLSQHTGGFVISENRLDELVPIENATMPDRTVIQWDKDDLESLGLLKVDVLALGMLTAIRKCFDLVKQYSGRSHTLASVFSEEGDPATYRMIQKADTIGIFQIESRAQMSMLPRLKPENFYDLVIQIAIVRPGPIQGDMVHPYLLRRKGEQAVVYESEALKAVLSRTLGIPIFQEQVMQIAIVAADFTPGEADELRRAMAAWKRRGGLEPFEVKLKQGMKKNGYSDEFAERIFNQIKGFGEYGFPESHSASFALLAYVSSWLKCHEPAAFTCALLNSQPMGFYGSSLLIADVKRHGVEVRPVDIRYSDWKHTLETDTEDRKPAIRLGMCLVKELKQTVAEKILHQRKKNDFSDIRELAHRCQLTANDLEALAAADALRGLEGHRFLSHWQVSGIESPMPIFGQPHFNEAQPMLRMMNAGEEVVEDYRTLGLSLKQHPLSLLRQQLREQNYVTASDLHLKRDGSIVHVAGIVTHRQRPGTATGVIFVTLEDETGLVNLIVWPAIAKAQRQALLHSRILLVSGIVQMESNVIHVIAGKLTDGAAYIGEIETVSRDFR